jgi:hypothetical protein
MGMGMGMGRGRGTNRCRRMVKVFFMRNVLVVIIDIDGNMFTR